MFEPEMKFIRLLDGGLSFDLEDEALRRFLSQELESSSKISYFQLPDMPRVHKLVWTTLLCEQFPVSCTPETRQFVSMFRFLKELEFAGSFATVSDAKEFLGLFPPIEVLDIKAIGIDEAGSSRQSPVFTGDMTNLRKLSVEECRTPLDWLVDDILAASCPSNLQSIRYEYDVPFSPTTFARLVTLSSESLQELIIQPPERTSV